MTSTTPRLLAALVFLSMATATCQADSFASSASSAGSASLGSVSDSSKGSSKSSTGGTKVAEGDYKVIEVAALAGQPGMLRVQFLDGATTEQVAAFPRCPKRNFRFAQCFDVEHMNALGRRMLRHTAQVFLQ